MNVLITGGCGFIGSQLALEILRRGKLNWAGSSEGEKPVTSITLVDRTAKIPPALGSAGRISAKSIDVGDYRSLAACFSSDTSAVFHLAAMVSGEGERDFDGCMRGNLDGTRNLLEACRQSQRIPRVVFASSVAVYGGQWMPQTVSDVTKANPQTTYGVTKQIGELLVNEYSRKGYIDGRTARLPTVFIRPGEPNAAASSFASGLFREPLAGHPCYLPVPHDAKIPLIGYRSVIANLLRLMECDSKQLGADRAAILPSISCRVGDLITTLENYAAKRGLVIGPVIDRPDDNITRMVNSWPAATEPRHIPGLDLVADESIEKVLDEYREDFLGQEGGDPDRGSLW